MGHQTPKAILPLPMPPAHQSRPQTHDNQYPEPPLPPQNPCKRKPSPSHPGEQLGLRVAPGGAEALSCCPETRSSGGSRQTSRSSKAADEGGRWAGGGTWGTAMMWPTSDSCTASPLASSCSRQGSPPAQEPGGEGVPEASRRSGEGTRLWGNVAHQGTESQRQSRGWDLGLLVPCSARAGVAQACCPSPCQSSNPIRPWSLTPARNTQPSSASDRRGPELASERQLSEDIQLLRDRPPGHPHPASLTL